MIRRGWKRQAAMNALTTQYAQHRYRTMRDPEYAASLAKAIAFETSPNTVRIMDLGAPPARNKPRASHYESALENYLKHLERKTMISLSVMTVSLLALWFASIDLALFSATGTSIIPHPLLTAFMGLAAMALIAVALTSLRVISRYLKETARKA